MSISCRFPDSVFPIANNKLRQEARLTLISLRHPITPCPKMETKTAAQSPIPLNPEPYQDHHDRINTPISPRDAFRLNLSLTAFPLSTLTTPIASSQTDSFHLAHFRSHAPKETCVYLGSKTRSQAPRVGMYMSSRGAVRLSCGRHLRAVSLVRLYAVAQRAASGSWTGRICQDARRYCTAHLRAHCGKTVLLFAQDLAGRVAEKFGIDLE